MNVNWRTLVRWFVGLIVIFNLGGNLQTTLAGLGELYVFPQEGAPGAELFLTALNQSAGASFPFYIVSPGTPDGISLGSFSADRSGKVTATVILPDLASGEATILIDSDNPASTSFTVLPAPVLMLDVSNGPPGTVVHFTVSNLVAGSLRLDYDGVPVLGPLAVSAGEYSGSFTVPRDRPAILGNPVQVEAFNLVAGRTIGQAKVTFTSESIPAPSAYVFRSIRLPADPVLPGQPFQINGQISPPPVGPLSGYQFKVLWKTAGGQVFPITNGASSLQSDGSFLVSAILPSLLNGSPQPAEEGGQVGVILFDNNSKSQVVSSYTPYGDFPAPPAFRIKVVGPGGAPIQDAVVDLRGDLANYTLQLFYSKADGSQASTDVSDLTTQPNQYLSFGQGILFPSKTDPYSCDPSPIYGRTDANGIFQPALALNDWLALAGKKVSLGPSYPGAYLVTPTETTFTVSVVGQYQGFGAINNHVPVPWTMDIQYRAASGAFYQDVNGQYSLIGTDPLVVTLQPIPPGTTIEKPIEMKGPGKVLKKFANYLGTGIPLTAFGNLYGFPSLSEYPDSIFLNPGAGAVVSFEHDAALYGALDQSNITLTFNNQVYPFQAITSSQCSANVTILTYSVTIPHSHRLAPGNYLGLVQVKDITGYTTKRYIIINVLAPPDWFHDPAITHRSVFYSSTSTLELTGDILAPGDPASSSTLDANLNKVGPVSNSAGATATYTQGLSASGASERKFKGAINYEAVNTPDSKDLSQAATTNTPITFAEGPITILDSGKFPLFRDVWGIPPIAGATIGADMWFKATLTYNGTIQLSSSGGGTSSTITVDPEATVGVDAWLDASALFGIIDAQAHAIPNISMSLPVTFQNGAKIDATKCFKYKLDIAWSASIGYCPFCVSDSGTEPVFSGHTPNTSYCPSPAAAVNAAAVTPPLPAASPSLAVDGVGGVLTVWRAGDGTIQYSLFNGVSWGTPLVLSSNASSGSPHVAYYAPGKAVAVWTQNALTPAQAQTASFANLLLHQHLVFAIWNGSSWSNPQDLTPSTTGDGAVTLAGCLSTNPACPAGGAVAAVWVHDAAGDLPQHQLRLFQATFQSGVWGPTQPVDGASTAMDSEPALAYQNGVPVVAWVRDADRNLGTLGDRKIAYRRLNGVDPVVVPTDLPAGVVEPSLAVNPAGDLRLAFTLATDTGGLSGNQRQLYSAAQGCSGSCTWAVQPLADWHGRAIFAEGPKLTIDGSGQGTILYRGLGMGPLPGGEKATFNEDAPGIIQGSGEVSKVVVNFSSSSVSPQYLTQDGLKKWQVNSVYDLLTNQTIVTAALPTGGFMASAAADTQAMAVDESVILLSLPNVPDYAIDAITPSAIFPLPGDPLSVEVSLYNAGGDGAQEIKVEAAWDGPPGVGLPAGTAVLIGPETGQLADTALTIDTSGVDLSLPHQLYLAINPDQAVGEASFGNNSSSVEIGGLPAPTDLKAAAKLGSSLVFLAWEAPRDPRIVGFHIYRFDGNGNVEPVGSSFEPDFADLFASFDAHYQYAVTSFDETGAESALSDHVEVDPVSFLKVYLPIVQRGY